MDRVGGFRGPRKNASPFLTVQADGKATAVLTEFPDKVFKEQLTPAALQELLHFVIDDQNFFQFNATEVQRQIEIENNQRGDVIKVSDVSTPVIRVTTADGSHEGSFNGIQLAGAYPSIRPLAQLAAVDARLLRLYEEVKIGSNLEAVLEIANQYLRRDPALPTLTRSDYQQTLYSEAVPDQRTVYFERILESGRRLSVSVLSAPNAPSQVRVR
jgi:hypothetical protein